MIKSDPFVVIKKIIYDKSILSKSPKRVYSLSLGLSILYNHLDKIDGHGHTSLSDGNIAIDELIFNTKIMLNSTLFLTEHNSLIHIPYVARHALLALDGKLFFSIIPGVELTCQLKGKRCHVILLATTQDSFLKKLIENQRQKYFKREITRLKNINRKKGVIFNDTGYYDFCNNRTPNWKITFDYLININKQKKNMKETMNDALSLRDLSTWWGRMPSLKDIYESAQKQKALIFISHIGDLCNKLGVKQVVGEMRKLKHLWIDKSENRGHFNNKNILQKNLYLKKKSSYEPVLIGTDFHQLYPKPKKYGIYLRNSLIKSFIDTSEAKYPLASKLLVYPSAYLTIFDIEVIKKYKHVFRSLLSVSTDDWVNRFIYCGTKSERACAEKIIAFAIVKDNIAALLLEALSNMNKNGKSMLEYLSQLIRDLRENGMYQSNDVIKSVTALAMMDICMRLGLYALASILADILPCNFPSNFNLGYSTYLKSTSCQEIVDDLCAFTKNENLKYFNNSRIIWRLKTRSSAFNTVFKTFISDGVCRQSISNIDAKNAAKKIFDSKLLDKNEAFNAYNSLVYDHFAATIIIDDECCDYLKLLSSVSVPSNWKIVQSEHVPRKDYHHRLWMLVEKQKNKMSPYLFELMVKCETDFNIGRAYQWTEKNCALAKTTSPCGYDDRFDRRAAMNNLGNGGSIFKILYDEVKLWQSKLSDPGK